jgi:DNA-binding HxlR family transcriptional regulator
LTDNLKDGVPELLLLRVPVTVDYELTVSGYSIEQLIDVMIKWGVEHRETFFGKQKNS